MMNLERGFYMRQRRKRFISIILTAVMIVMLFPSNVYAVAPPGHTHSFDETTHGCVCGAHENGLSDHDGWTTWSNPTSLPTNEGSYYLTTDVTLNSVWNVPQNKTINLCLNGHMIIGYGAYMIPLMISDYTLNIFDCSDSIHYFTDKISCQWDEAEEEWISEDGKDGFFETYEPSYDPSGKIEGEDYIVIYGGGFTNMSSVFNTDGGSVVNMYGGTIIGCSPNDSCLIMVGSGNMANNAQVNLHGVTIRDNYQKEEGGSLILTNNNSTIFLDNCLIYNNNVETIIGSYGESNKKGIVEIVNSQVKNNVITEDAGIKVEYAELKIVGSSYIYNNKNDGNQSNVCILEGVTIDADSLEDGAFIGVEAEEMPSIGNTMVIAQSLPNNVVSAFYSDNPLYYLEYNTNTSELFLKNRILEQPSASNGYEFIVETTGLQSFNYQWYGGSKDIVELKDNNTFDYETMKASYDSIEKEWTAYDYREDDYSILIFFSIEALSGQKLVFESECDDSLLGEDFVISLEGVDYDYVALIENTEYSLNVNKDGEYMVYLYLEGDQIPADKLPKIKNARLEKLELTDAISGQTDSKFTYSQNGTYACKLNVTDSLGNTSSVYSKAFALEFEEFEVSFNANGYGQNPNTQIVVSGGKVTVPENPTEDNLIFDGWFMDSECTTSYDFDTVPSSDITLYAGWKYKQPTSVLGGENKITGVDSTMEYQLVGDSDWTAIEGTQVEGLLAGEYNVRVKKNGNIFASDAVIITVTDPDPSKPDAPTGVEGGVNVITGVDSTMEYRNINSSEWITIATNQIDNVPSGDYYIRIKADDTHIASDYVTVTVTDPDPDPEPEPEPEKYYIEDLENQLNTAIQYEAGPDTVILWTEGDSLPQSVIDLILQSDVTVEFKFTYEGVDYDLFLNKFNVKDLKLDWYGPYVLAQFANNTAVGAEELEGDTYTVKEGDTMGAIAAKFGMSLEALTALNPQITDIDFIRVNQKIRVK